MELFPFYARNHQGTQTVIFPAGQLQNVSRSCSHFHSLRRLTLSAMRACSRAGCAWGLGIPTPVCQARPSSAPPCSVVAEGLARNVRPAVPALQMLFPGAEPPGGSTSLRRGGGCSHGRQVPVDSLAGEPGGGESGGPGAQRPWCLFLPRPGAGRVRALPRQAAATGRRADAHGVWPRK